jgi:hypothetical protein
VYPSAPPIKFVHWRKQKAEWNGTHNNIVHQTGQSSLQSNPSSLLLLLVGGGGGGFLCVLDKQWKQWKGRRSYYGNIETRFDRMFLEMICRREEVRNRNVISDRNCVTASLMIRRVGAAVDKF